MSDFHSDILAATDEMTKSNTEMTGQAVQQKIEADLDVLLSLTGIRCVRRNLGVKIWKGPLLANDKRV